MDTNNFDRLNSTFAGTSSRRQALKLMGGGLVGSFALAAGIKGATAQQRVGVGQLVQGLVNVNVGAIVVGDITVQDVIDVENVLNNNQIRALNNILNNNEIASRNGQILTNFLNNNQVVVGVLSGPTLVVQNLLEEV